MTKPYMPPMPRDWWNKKPAYRMFMLRELSSVFVALFVIELLCFVAQVSNQPADRGEMAMNEFLEELGSPLFLAFHAVVLAFALLHSITWFNLTPKVMVIRRGEERVPDVLVAGSNYVAWLVVSLILWWIVKG